MTTETLIDNVLLSKMTEQGKRFPLPQTRDELYDSFAPLSKDIDPDSFVILSGRGNIPLAESVGKMLGKTVDQPCFDWADGETGVEIHPSVREKRVFILQSMYPRQNDRLEETVFMVNAAHKAFGEKIIVLMPYTPYGRQDRKIESRSPGSAVIVGNQLAAEGAYGLLTLDPHADQTAIAPPIPWDLIFSDKVTAPKVEEILQENGGLEDAVVIAPDLGAVKRARRFADKLNGSTNVAFVDKIRKNDVHDKTESKRLVGDVRDRPGIIVDDVISTGGTLEGAAELAKAAYVSPVYAVAGHGLFVPDKVTKTTLPERLQLKDPKCPIDRIIVTDSILQRDEIQQMEGKIDIATVAPMFAVAIMCYLTGKSLSDRLIK